MNTTQFQQMCYNAFANPNAQNQIPQISIEQAINLLSETNDFSIIV